MIEPFEGASSASIALFLLGTAFGALLLQRGVLPIHGSAILIDGECVIFTGESGAGKSTLSLALREKGYPLLTDDVAALSIHEDGTIWVQPGYPQQKVWKDSADKMGVDVSGLSRIQLLREKYYLPIERGFHDTPSRLKAVCEIKPDDCSDVSISEFNGINRLLILMNNTYRVEYMHYFDLKQDHFKNCTLVAKKVPIYRITRPINQFTTDKQIELVKEILKPLDSAK